jgi:hypothetical protein
MVKSSKTVGKERCSRPLLKGIIHQRTRKDQQPQRSSATVTVKDCMAILRPRQSEVNHDFSSAALLLLQSAQFVLGAEHWRDAVMGASSACGFAALRQQTGAAGAIGRSHAELYGFGGYLKSKISVQ